MKRILMPLPAIDFDPSEAAVSWRILSQLDVGVDFATPDGAVSTADPLMLTGEGLDLVKPIKVLGLMLRANSSARRDYSRMITDGQFVKPLRYSEISVAAYDGLLLPGGHCARGMRPYLESGELQEKVAGFFDSGKPVAAICHGVLLAARSVSVKTGKSVLYGRKTTALTWKLEQTAWKLMRLAGNRGNPDYYRTYIEKPGEPAGYWSVQAEVTRALEDPCDFEEPRGWVASSGLFRDSQNNSGPSFVVRDGNYVSARWPGDVHRFAHEFAGLLNR